MSSNNPHAEWERRKDEIQRIATEPLEEAWSQFEVNVNDEECANELGLQVEYFRHLLAQEFVNRLTQGMTSDQIPKFESDLETLCWKTAINKIMPDLSATIDMPLSIQIRLKLLSLFKLGISFQEISQRFDLAEKHTRALVALALVEDGLTLEEVGADIGLTRERTRQIIAELGISVRAIRERTSNQAALNQKHLVKAINLWIVEHPGCYLFEITDAFNISEAALKKMIPEMIRRLVLGGKSKNISKGSVKYTREQALTALRMAYELRNPLMGMYSVIETRPLTGPFYDNSRKNGEIYGPSSQRILQVFGTWKEACEEAGVPSVDAPRDAYSLLWTDEQLIEQIAEFISTSENSSVESFDKWCRLDNTRSSAGTIRNQIGPWSDSYELALLHLRQKWTNE
jgi:hypothetical protein